MNAKLNFVYFHVHDLGKHLPVYGAPFPTPALERFANESVVFTNAFCSSTACTPSRACALSGKYAHSSGCIGLAHMGWPLAGSEQTMVDDFNAAGYQSILSGVNHERHPRSDRYAIDTVKHWDDWHTENAVDNALSALDNLDSNTPFFLNVGSQEPHASTWHLFADTPVPEDETWMPAWCPDNQVSRKEFGKFQASINYMDKHFGRFIDGLRRRSLLERSVIVFTCDHGISGPRAKGTMYDRGTEISLMVRMPGGQLGGEFRDQLIGNVDFRPTWAEVAEISNISPVEGHSFASAIENSSWQGNNEIYAERNYHGERPYPGADNYIDLYDPIRSVRGKRFKYIWNVLPEVRHCPSTPFDIPQDWSPQDREGLDYIAPGTTRERPEIEFFDLEQDPQEFINLAKHPEYRAIMEGYAEKLKKWMKDTKDFVPNSPLFIPEPPGWGENWS